MWWSQVWQKDHEASGYIMLTEVAEGLGWDQSQAVMHKILPVFSGQALPPEDPPCCPLGVKDSNVQTVVVFDT